MAAAPRLRAMSRPRAPAVALCLAAHALGAPAEAAPGAGVEGMASGSAPFCAFENVYGAGPPPYYVAYEVGKGKGKGATSITIDGDLDDPAWLVRPEPRPTPPPPLLRLWGLWARQEVGFTRSNPDICGDSTYCPPDTPSITDPASTCKLSASACKTPRFSTRQKIRWDSEFLYIGAELEEPQVWANNTEHQSVIFSDNDYEIFISPDGTNHYYKEYEMNARGVWSAAATPSWRYC